MALSPEIRANILALPAELRGLALRVALESDGLDPCFAIREAYNRGIAEARAEFQTPEVGLEQNQEAQL